MMKKVSITTNDNSEHMTFKGQKHTSRATHSRSKFQLFLYNKECQVCWGGSPALIMPLTNVWKTEGD